MKDITVKYLTERPGVSADTPDMPYEIRQICRRMQGHQTPGFPNNDLIQRIGGGNFIETGMENTLQVILLCDLRPHSRILEVGCGCGRNARYIAPLLDPLSGRFMGFDVDEEMITWCQDYLTPIFPNTRFDFANIFNRHYTPEGVLKDYEYQFPYSDKTFDIVFMPSVFTHILKSGFEHYLSEIHRVLKPHGRLLSWHFLTTREIINAKQGIRSCEYMQYDNVSWVKNLDVPSHVIAYDTDYVLESLRSAGFTVHVKMTGQWDGQTPTGFLSHQDRILSTKNP